MMANIYKSPPHFPDRWNAMFGALPGIEPQVHRVKTISFVVTENCNLRCTYCYECSKNADNVMSEETARKAIDLILDDRRMNGYIDSEQTPCVIIEFMGGEPLLGIDTMDFIADYFRYRAFELGHPWAPNYMFSLSTNGVLFETEKVQRFLAKNTGRVSVGITIDGDKPLHDACRVFPDGSGSYDIVSGAVRNAVEKHGATRTKVTFAPGNIAYLSKSIPHLFGLGLKDIYSNCVFEEGWTWEDARVFYRQLRELADYMIESEAYTDSCISIFDEIIGTPLDEKDTLNWCGGNGLMLSISTEGKLYPCTRYMPFCMNDKTLPPYSIGDIERGVLPESESSVLRCLKCVDRRSQSSDECFNCPVARGCAWCTAYHYDKFGTPNKRATFICCMHKARVLANHYYWNRLYRHLGLNKEFPLYLSEDDIQKITGGEIYDG